MTPRKLALLATLALPVLSTAARAQPAIETIAAHPGVLSVRLSGAGEPVRLVALRPYETDAAGAPVVWEGPADGSEVSIARENAGVDRLYAKFRLVDASTGEAIGPAHWVDDLSALPARDFAMPWPASKKGVSCPVDLEDLAALGARYADLDVMLAAVLDWSGGPATETWEVDGQRIPLNAAYLADLDRKVRRMTELGINVTLIVLNGVPETPDPANPLVNPRTDLAGAPYHLGAFNCTDERGVRYYRAAFECLAERYSRPSAEHGWVSGYVVGNELPSHWAWHNMGLATAEEVTREYADQLRLAWLAVRRRHSGLRVYASLDHTWATCLDPDPRRSMRGDQLLERLNQLTKAEGDFPWHVAFHPYPEDLFEPRFWNDRTAELGLDSPRVTFRNLEVLPAFLDRDAMRFRGEPRRIILSEQGFHCPDSPEGETIQAAAFACAYHKVRHMPTIDAFILHRHVDHRDQDGLRLGLWTRKLEGPDPCAPERKRRMWEVFRAADTDDWPAVSEFAKRIIGIDDWDEVLPSTGPVPAISGRFPPPLEPGAVVYDLREHLRDARTLRCLDWRATWAEGPDGLLYPAVFHHPPEPTAGLGEAAYSIDLPQLAPGARLTLRFGTVLTGPSLDGVRMSIALNGVEAWAETQTGKDQPRMHRLDLAAHAGERLDLALRVDALGNHGADWAHWLRPIVEIERP